jgi:GT2 family glycosyltransferase
VSASEDLAVGYCHPAYVPGAFASYLGALLTSDFGRKHIGAGILNIESGPQLCHSRNEMARHFLASDRQWLLTIDTDMVFTPQDAERLLDSADPDEAPVVGGLCRGSGKPMLVAGIRQDTPDGIMYRCCADVDELIATLGSKNGLVEVDMTGTGFLLVHRSVFERIGGRWFDYLDAGFMMSSEDVSFCQRVQAAGIPIYVNTNVPVGHLKLEVRAP